MELPWQKFRILLSARNYAGMKLSLQFFFIAGIAAYSFNDI